MSDEQQYLDLVRRVLQKKTITIDRTKVGVIRTFGPQMQFDLRTSFPLLTTKRIAWKSVVEELIWFISGSTDAKVLARRGVNIWNANGSQSAGDLGPVYGFQWRHFGAEYKTCDDDYTGKGIDQLAKVIKQIRHDPGDRRIIMTAWNPAQLHEMALPPCHCFVQFYVDEGELSCKLYQRSGDLGLGVPFNIASYALLTCMIAHVTGLKPGDFIHSLGDAHIYSNHIEPLHQQLQRTPKQPPTLRIKRAVSKIEDFCFEDFELENYHPAPPIKMEMAL